MRYLVGVNGEVHEVEALGWKEALSQLGVTSKEGVVVRDDGTDTLRKLVVELSLEGEPVSPVETKPHLSGTLEQLLASGPDLDDIMAWCRSQYPKADLMLATRDINNLRTMQQGGYVTVIGDEVHPTSQGLKRFQELRGG